MDAKNIELGNELAAQPQDAADKFEENELDNDSLLYSNIFRLKVDLPLQLFNARILCAIDQRKKELREVAFTALKKVQEQNTSDEIKKAKKKAIVDMIAQKLILLN